MTTPEVGLHHEGSVLVDAPPEQVWAVISDVTRTGEWSPVCRACWWAEGDEPGPDGPRVGAWFHGRNETAERTWETRSQVAVADAPREFTWLVNGSLVRWSYTLAPEGGGTRLTETWDFLPEGIAYFHDKYGDAAQQQIDERHRAALDGIPATLQRIRQVVEAG